MQALVSLTPIIVLVVLLAALIAMAWRRLAVAGSRQQQMSTGEFAALVFGAAATAAA